MRSLRCVTSKSKVAELLAWTVGLHRVVTVFPNLSNYSGECIIIIHTNDGQSYENETKVVKNWRLYLVVLRLVSIF